MLNAPQNQRGIVLIMALIVLVALTLSALALTRSVYTSNAIAGNLAFQQAATHAADAGIEAAVAWLEANNGQTSSSTSTACTVGSSVLACDQLAYGYKAHKGVADDPSSGQTWAQYWQLSVAPYNLAVTLPAASNNDNTVSYIIQRMCSGSGDAQASGNSCTVSPVASSSSCQGGSSCDAQMVNLGSVSQVYYRITVQVTGPHNAQSYVQSMVAL
jgi:type IV pilus assembly protein PilX